MDDVVVKAVAQLSKGVDDGESEHGTFEVILSTPDEDRDGEKVLSDEWEPLPEHITFDIDHGMSVSSTVGSGKPEIDEDGRLRVKGSYSSLPLAQNVRTLVNEGHIRTTSVAFLRKDDGTKDGKRVVRRELLNGAFVAVPANPNAVVLSSKALQAVEEASERKTVADLVEKAIAGSYEERERAVYDAVASEYRNVDADVWAYPVATFDDSVVFRVSGGDNAGTWRAGYTIDDAGVATLGEAERVVITEVVTTVPEGSKSASEAPDPTAEQAAGSGADDAETLALAAAKAQARRNALDSLFA